MQINLSCSYTMDSQRNLVEDRTIRIPQEYRQVLGFEVGQFINLQTKQGNSLSLQVLQAFNEDVAEDASKAYVTTNIFYQVSFGEETCAFEVVDNITLGTDPEFFLISNKKVLPATRYFNKWSSVGSDGMLAEIRPAPSTDENTVVNNIRLLLKRARNRVDKRGSKHVGLYGGSAYAGITAGFHLHYGIPKSILGDTQRNRSVLQQVVRALDYYVGLPCVIQEGLAESQRRCSEFLPYGKAGDFRLDFRTLEYRVPGGTMLKHPTLTKGLLALGAVVIEDVISRVKHRTGNFTNLEAIHTCESLNELYPNVPGYQELFNLICTPESKGAHKHINRVMTDVYAMVGVDKRLPAINDFFNNLETVFTGNLDANWETR